MEPIADSRRPRRWPGPPARWQVDHEQIDRPAAQECAGDRQALVEIARADDDQPVEVDPAGHGLDRIEAPGHVQPGHDRAGRLRLGGGSQGERRLAARPVATQAEAGGAWQALGAEDRVEGPEARRDRAFGGCRSGQRCRLAKLLEFLGKRHRRECADHLPEGSPHLPRSCRTPARLKGRQSRCHIGGQGRHETVSIEHLFDSRQGQRGGPDGGVATVPCQGSISTGSWRFIPCQGTVRPLPPWIWS